MPQSFWGSWAARREPRLLCPPIIILWFMANISNIYMYIYDYIWLFEKLKHIHRTRQMAEVSNHNQPIEKRCEIQLIAVQLIWNWDDLRFNWLQIQLIWNSIKILIRDSIDLRFNWLEIQVAAGSVVLKFNWFGSQLIWVSIKMRFNWFEIQLIWGPSDLGFNGLQIQLAWNHLICGSTNLNDQLQIQLIWDSTDLQISPGVINQIDNTYKNHQTSCHVTVIFFLIGTILNLLCFNVLYLNKWIQVTRIFFQSPRLWRLRRFLFRQEVLDARRPRRPLGARRFERSRRGHWKKAEVSPEFS